MSFYTPWVYPLPGAVTPPVPLEVTTTSLANGVEDVAYSVTLAAAGGTPPYTWALSPAVSPNVLPDGMTLTTAGALQGTPTVPGTFPIVLRVTDSLLASDDSGSMELTIAAAPTGALVVTTTTLPNAKRGTAYTGASLAAAAGTAPYTWALVAPDNVLPPGLSLNASTGAITGTPTTQGEWPIKARATDDASAQATSGLLPIIVDQVDALAIATAPTLNQGEVNTAYSRELVTTGGYGAITWSKLSGDYPAGITLGAGTGVLSGTPSAEGTSAFTLRATDSEARTADQTFSITVVADGAIEGAHDYFNYWDSGAGATYKHYSNSLRTTPLIQSVYANASAADNWEYDAAMDAAKLTTNYGTLKQDGTISDSWNATQLVLPTNQPTSLTDRIVMTWDWYWPIEFKENCGTVTNFKTYQVRPMGKGWWTLMNNQGPAKKLAANVGFTVTDEFRAVATAQGRPRPDGLLSHEQVEPAGEGTYNATTRLYSQLDYQRSVPVDHSVWHRVVIEVRLFQDPSAFTSWSATYLSGAPLSANPADPSGRWHMVSKWYMSETMDPQRVLYQVPMGWYADSYSGPITSVLFEMNSSKVGAIGPMNGWGRNFLALKDMYADESDTNLFRRPVR